MKKLLALLLALVMALSLVACGGGDSTPSGGDAADDGAAVTDNDTPDTPDTAGDDHDHDYLTYDDLTRTESFYVWTDDAGDFGFEIDCPDVPFDSHGWGIGSEDSVDYAIVVAHPERPVVNGGATLEEAFWALLNGESAYHSILKAVNNATYGEATPETERFSLDCGCEAIAFSGTQPRDDYGTLYDCPVYGYCTFVEGVPVIVSYILFDPANVDTATETQLAHYVDEMVNTLRPTEG